MRCEAELMPQLWLQLEHKHLERRLLVAETSGALALNSSSRIHPLLLSICQQLIHDKLGLIFFSIFLRVFLSGLEAENGLEKSQL